MDEFIAVKTEPLDIDEPNEESLCAPEEEPSEPEVTSHQPESFCFLCLRDRPHNTIFHEFDIDNSGTLRDTIKDILACELPAKKVLICTPCWKLLKLVEIFKACCLKAFSWVEQHVQLERVVPPKPMAVEEDRWFSDENVKAIDGVKEAVDRRVKWMEQSGTEVKMEIEESCVGNGADQRVWECKKCHRKFYGPRSYAAHMRYCKGDAAESQLFKCPTCPASFRDQNNFQTHVNMHKENKAYECRITCGERFYGKEQRYRHEIVCRKNLGLEKPVEDSYQGIDPEADNKEIDVQECVKCHRRFDGMVSFHNHKYHCENKGELKMKLNTCKICSISFVTKQLLKAHLNKHKGIKPYECRKFCDRTFYGTSSRYAHEMICHKLDLDVQAVECESCHRFLEKRGLKVHMKNCQKDKEEGRRLYQCDTCPITFTKSAFLKAHRNKHLGIKPFECEFNCGGFFVKKWNRNNHHKICPKRPAAVPTNSENSDLKLAEEDGETLEVIPCEKCGRLFDSKGGLMHHLRECRPENTKGNDDQQLHKCPICSVSFTLVTLLQTHIGKHNGVKTYACSRCGLKFLSLKLQNTHEKNCQVHRCRSCEQEFSTFKSLVDHVKDTHGVGKPTCKICGKQFHRRFFLLRHQKEKHPDELTEVGETMTA